LAVAGIILPILPTTPILLVAVWAFGKPSPEVAQRIRNHRVPGPPVRDWQDHGVISTNAKLLNKINSIRKTRPEYAKMLQRGYDLLKKSDYKPDP
jgi:uncharacterized membrane protein YbaN (DUF454 family)